MSDEPPRSDPVTERLADAASRPGVSVRECELVVEEGPDRGRTFRLTRARVVVGKDAEADVALTDPSVSRAHLAIEDRPEGFVLRDLGSTNGTVLNGTQTREAFLAPGAGIKLGRTTLRFQPRNTLLPVEPSARGELAGMIGQSARMRQLFGYLERVGPTELAVMLLGDTGTGKEMVARGLHQLSRRKAGPFVVFDCGAHEAALLPAALFGHKEGAFTGAVGNRKGLFAAASGGTIFLDEIGELPLDLQPRLLRVLEHREVLPLGADAPVRVDVRVVCATHRDLRAMVADGKFRQDLFYRLSGLVLEIPPLRERPDDVLALARHFLTAAGSPLEVSPDAAAVLAAHAWPGNVRELKNVIERAAVFAASGALEPQHLMLGPVRPFWIAAPLTLFGVGFTLWRLVGTQRDDEP